VDYEKLTDARAGEPSEVIRGRVQAARLPRRFAGTALTCNADMSVGDVRSAWSAACTACWTMRGGS
jgi:hypothetical protein